MKANDGDFFTLEKKKRKKRLSYTAPPILCPRFWVQYILTIFTFHTVQKVSAVHFHHLCSHHIPFPFQVFHLE